MRGKSRWILRNVCSQLQKRASYKGEAEQTKRSGQKLTWKTKVDNEVVVGGGGGGWVWGEGGEGI